MLKKEPLRPAVKGGRLAAKNSSSVNETPVVENNNVNKTPNNKEAGSESESGESENDSDAENKPAPTTNVRRPNTTPTGVTTGRKTVASTTPLRPREENKDIKKQYNYISISKKEPEKEEPKRFPITKPLTGKTNNSNTEEKDQTPKYQSALGRRVPTTTKDEKDDNLSSYKRKVVNDADSRVGGRKEEPPATNVSVFSYSIVLVVNYR